MVCSSPMRFGIELRFRALVLLRSRLIKINGSQENLRTYLRLACPQTLFLLRRGKCGKQQRFPRRRRNNVCGQVSIRDGPLEK